MHASIVDVKQVWHEQGGQAATPCETAITRVGTGADIASDGSTISFYSACSSSHCCRHCVKS